MRMTRVIEIKMRVLVNTEEEADALIDALADVEEENFFPTGAAIERNWIELGN